MRKISLMLCGLGLAICCNSLGKSADKPSKINAEQLVEVTSKNKAQCIEYFSVGKKLYCSTKPLLNTQIAKDIAAAEPFQLKLDTNEWKVAWTDIKPDLTTIEYLPHGQTLNDWQQMITTQFIANIPTQITPKILAQQFIKTLQQQGFNPSVSYYQESRTQVIFELQIFNPPEQAQNEIQKIIATAKGIYLLHYVVKKEDMGQQERDKWLAFVTTRNLKE